MIPAPDFYYNTKEAHDGPKAAKAKIMEEIVMKLNENVSTLLYAVESNNTHVGKLWGQEPINDECDKGPCIPQGYIDAFGSINRRIEDAIKTLQDTNNNLCEIL